MLPLQREERVFDLSEDLFKREEPAWVRREGEERNGNVNGEKGEGQNGQAGKTHVTRMKFVIARPQSSSNFLKRHAVKCFSSTFLFDKLGIYF